MGSSLRQLQATHPQRGQRVRSLRGHSQDLLGSVGTPSGLQSPWVNGLHNSGPMSSYHPSPPEGEIEGTRPCNPEVSDLDVSGLGLKHRSSNLQTPCSSYLTTLNPETYLLYRPFSISFVSFYYIPLVFLDICFFFPFYVFSP